MRHVNDPYACVRLRIYTIYLPPPLPKPMSRSCTFVLAPLVPVVVRLGIPAWLWVLPADCGLSEDAGGRRQDCHHPVFSANSKAEELGLMERCNTKPVVLALEFTS